MRALLFLLPLLATCQNDETVSGYTEPGAVYVLQELDGEAFAPRATLTFPEPGQVAGEAPCNRYSGGQALPYPWFEVTTIAATRRACPELAAESAFLAALGEMSLAEAAGKVLILSNDAGRQMVFKAE